MGEGKINTKSSKLFFILLRNLLKLECQEARQTGIKRPAFLPRLLLLMVRRPKSRTNEEEEEEDEEEGRN